MNRLTSSEKTENLWPREEWSGYLGPRWGEWGVNHVKCHGPCDGLSRFRNNYDCSHVVPISPHLTKYDGFMFPRPFQTDIAKYITTEHNHCRHVPRPPRPELFPQHDIARRYEDGQYTLCSQTRDDLYACHRRLHRATRYGEVFPDITAEVNKNAMEKVKCQRGRTSFPVIPTDNSGIVSNRFMTGQRKNKFVLRMFKSILHKNIPSRTRTISKEVLEENYIKPWERRSEDEVGLDEDVLRYIYNDRLPSFLHRVGNEPNIKDDVTEEEYVSDMVTPQYLRPRVEPILLGSMVAVEKEWQEEKSPLNTLYNGNMVDRNHTICPVSFEKLARHVRFQNDDTFSGSAISPGTELETVVNKFPNLRYCSLSSECTQPEKRQPFNSSILGLQFKSHGQDRFYTEHPENIPDLRDFTRYSKKVFFYGYNSYAFRG